MIDPSPKVQQELLRLLDAAIEAAGAVKGNLQQVDRASQQLRLVVQRGFDAAFVRAFETVAWDDATACGRAFRNGARVVVPDVTLDRAFKPYVKAARAAGFLAVQSTPVMDDSGQVIGVLSTHFAQPCSLSAKAGRALDALAVEAARRLAAIA